MEKKKVILICELKFAYTSPEYFRDSEHDENLRKLITGIEMA